MKAVILAGGLGTRLSEETVTKPKPMVEIGGRPILWHIMKIYSHYGINEFIICCGYKGYMIKEYFANYFLQTSDVTFDIQNNKMSVNGSATEPWKVTLIDTGENTMTGGRLKRVKNYISDDPAFCFTYGDGIGNIDIQKLVQFHFQSGKKATLTATRPSGRYGVLKIRNGNEIEQFQEKPEGETSWVNGGFFVLNPSAIEYISSDNTSWEDSPLKGLAMAGELNAFKHEGFWQPMDTLRDKMALNEMWATGSAPWKIW